MALQTRVIKSKIKSVGNIRKITKAMELVAASKMRKTIAAALASRVYAELAVELLANLAQDRDSDHPLIHKGKGKKLLLVVVMSDKGLCGGFNVVAAKAANRFISEHRNKTIELVTIGKHAERYARRHSLKIVGSFNHLPDNLSSNDLLGIVRLLTEEFLGKDYLSVYLVYNHFISPLVYKPMVRKMLPISVQMAKNALEELGGQEQAHEIKTTSMSRYLFEPGPGEVLETILPRLLESLIFQSLLESSASEHSARMLAMKNASDNARDMIEDLTLNYNHARQDSITQEISEISAGANALSAH